ncbi:MAG TPA: ParA family protein [Thermoanaerobaculia bacterium]|nr:ParA family protein [Thermoanaerobaculia bacterium]
MNIVAVVNQKGGVGKTTTAINLGAALGALERRVLLVDCDPQGNASRGLAIEASPPLLYEALRGESTLADCVRPTGFPGLDIVPSNRDLVGIEVEFVGQAGWEHRLREALGTIDGYDLVLLDCPPSLGHLTICALTAADRVLIPLQCEYFALEGMGELLATLRRVRQTLNPSLEVAGIVLTMYDERTRLSKDVVAEVRRHFSDRVYNTVVPRNIRLAEAPSHGIPVLQYDIKSRGAQAYLSLARELLPTLAVAPKEAAGPARGGVGGERSEEGL